MLLSISEIPSRQHLLKKNAHTKQIPMIHKTKRAIPRPLHTRPILLFRIPTHWYLGLTERQTQLRNGRGARSKHTIVLCVCRCDMHRDDVLDYADVLPIDFEK